MKRLHLFGAAHGFALKTVLAINAVEPTFELAGYLDDDPALHGTELLDVPILGGRSLLPGLAEDPDAVFFNNVMGDLGRRAEITELLDDHGCAFTSLIDPRIDVLDLQHGEGVFIGAFANFGASARLGDHTVIMQAVVLGDDTVVGDNCFVATQATIGSRCVVGPGTFVGPNSVTLIDRSIGEGCTIGAGAVVTKDVPDRTRMFSPPAKPG